MCGALSLFLLEAAWTLADLFWNYNAKKMQLDNFKHEQTG